MTNSTDINEDGDIAASLRGDGDAYRRLVVRYQNQIAGQMQRFTRDRDVLEELVQEVFVQAYLGLKGFRGRSPFLHWLRRIATRVGYRYWKNLKRKRDQETDLQENLPYLPADSESLSSYEASDLIFHLFKRLAPADRLVLTLYYFDEYTTEEIASQTGWTRTLVKVRLFRARKKLKALLKTESTKDEENE